MDIETENSATMKPCTMCFEPIKIGAKKCPHCGSHQRWLGRVSDWTLALSLLVALVAIIGAVSPAIKGLLTPNSPLLHFSDPEFQPGKVSVRVTNVGGQSAMLDQAIITIPQSVAGQPYIFVLPASESAEKRDVAPGETEFLTFTFDRTTYDPPQISAEQRPCVIEIFDSYRSVSCDEVRYLGSILPPTDRRGGLPEEGPAPPQEPAKWERYDL